MITDKSKPKELWPKAKKYIQDNHGRMAISEMARNLGVARMAVMNFMDEQDLPVRKFAATPAPKEKPSNKFFRHDKAWI